MALKGIDYINIIDEQYNSCKKQGLSRTSLEWGMFSSEMNRELRLRIESGDKEHLILKYVFTYWVTVSQLLELHFKYNKKLYGKSKIRKKYKELLELRNIILKGIDTDPLGFNIEPCVSWQDLVVSLTSKLIK